MTTVPEPERCPFCGALLERAELNIGVYSDLYCPMGCDADDPDDYDESD